MVDRKSGLSLRLPPARVRAGSAMNFLPLATIFSREFSDLRPTAGAILLAVAHSG